MGDRGGNHGYVVQPGDSYEKIAQKLYGNQRAFGDLMRANGGVALQPGMTLNVTPRRKDNNYFVSGSDVASANAAGANSGLPQMQQYGDYQANYKAAIAAGGTGVKGSPFQGTGQNAGVAGAVGGSPSGINWAPGGIAISLDKPKPILSGRDAAEAWKAGQAANPTPAPNIGINATGSAVATPVQPSMGAAPAQNPLKPALVQPIYGNGSFPTAPQAQPGQPSAPTPENFSPETLATVAALDAEAKKNGGNVYGDVTPVPNPNVATTLPPTPTTPGVQGNLPPSVQARADQDYATLTVRAIAANKDVPSYLSRGQSAALYQMGVDDPKLGQKLFELYDLVNDEFVSRKSLFSPGTPLNGNLPDGYNYSNTPPSGYNDQSNYRTPGGRRGGGGGNRNGQRGYNSKDYSLGLGQ